ncbi:H+/Cl-antiporter ClcA [Pedobacter sp. ok626]|uniref:chloride channel protein n=1 Tax=Pedobacter sp. ok626 TaxID=1761882 RepID=UPI00087F0F9F|nr:chloride channel protein [Pedobacter sp. ok626]SDJ77682.1 H+/Cl-antiporter ClcA [Pedobacter sp. ok626]
MKKRLLQISLLSIAVAILISIIAKGLVLLINLVTNICFYGNFDFSFNSPANNHLGLWVIILPASGGVLVGLMALFGSKAIRGHGIPEAMEQVLTNQSKIKPSIAFLKPISSAIAIGSGGPFGAEGPIIATGGALGSTIGQLFKITSNERKIILAAGATAGMSAIFGTPIAAIFLAIELLLFEFSPKAILPVALACITGAAGHQLLFESGPVFPMPDLQSPSNMALGIYSAIGIIIGFMSLGLTKIVYWIEDTFEKLPIHWMWWPAIGGLAVGTIGYFAPHTLGVGYDNIISMLSGKASLALMLSLCFFKFLSWAIALGSGTSGGTLAPLLTIGGATGAVLGSIILLFFPASGISISMAALIGMSSMFAGASRAYLTSITFALEATMQSHALLPLLGACTASYLISFFFMENTIMTEKIARRGIYTPDSYEPDVLRGITVAQVLGEGGKIAVEMQMINELAHKDLPILKESDRLSKAVELMASTGEEFLPVVASGDLNKVIGILNYKDVLHAYKLYHRENQEAGINLSLKRQRLKIIVKRRKLMDKTQKHI